MGFALEPGKRLPVHLEYDADVPESERPVFYMRAPSWRSQIAYVEAYDNLYQADRHTDIRSLSSAMIEVLEMAYCGWANQRNTVTGEVVEYSPDAWFDVVVLDEAQELIRKGLEAGKLAVEEKKSCASRRASAAGSCASPVDTASATTGKG